MRPTTHIEPRPFRDILVATDFSANAGCALEWAVELARRHGARLQVVHAVEAMATTVIPLAMQQELARSLGVVENIARSAQVPVRCTTSSGRAWEVIVRAADEVGADRLVMGARGRGAYARLLLGSTADRVVRAAAAPVLTIHPDHQVRRCTDLRTVVVGMDFSEEATWAAKAAADLLSRLTGQGRMILLHAWQPVVEYGFDTPEGEVVVTRLDDPEEAAAKALEDRAGPLRSDRLQVETVVRQGYPASVIQREAEAMGADIIAVGTHGRCGLSHFMLGSIAERVLHHAPCPVLTVRHPAAARALAGPVESPAVATP
jgi:nucleotide-binding universal stress UspA family protein